MSTLDTLVTKDGVLEWGEFSQPDVWPYTRTTVAEYIAESVRMRRAFERDYVTQGTPTADNYSIGAFIDRIIAAKRGPTS